MNQMNDEEAFVVLREAGFTVLETDRLIQLRQDYKAGEPDQAPLDYARLRFARWLVTTGRLTDQIAPEDASCGPALEEIPIYKAVVVCLGLKRHQRYQPSPPD
jgi:hypothetical protein